MPRKGFTYTEFLTQLELRNPQYREGTLKIIGEYCGMNEKILVEDEYGQCLCKPKHLLTGCELSIKSAVNKTKYWINKLPNYHKSKYRYDKVSYINNYTKVTIYCNSHNGYFKQTPSDHHSGRGCRKCSNLITAQINRLTHSEFETRLFKKNKYFKGGLIKLSGKYVFNEDRIIVETKYGKHSLLPSNLLEGKMPMATSAIDPLDYLHNQLLDRSKRYRDKEYSLVSLPSKTHAIVETKYGKAIIRKDLLLENKLPSIRSAIDQTSYFLNMVKERYILEYGTEYFVYTEGRAKVRLTCKKHGQFSIRTDGILEGKGCPECGRESSALHHAKNPTGWSYSDWIVAAERSNNFDSFQVYIINCWDENENFFKIGRTFTPLRKRFTGDDRLPYKYTPLKIFSGEAKEMCELEKELKRINKENKYLPTKEFTGKTECYTKIKL